MSTDRSLFPVVAVEAEKDVMPQYNIRQLDVNGHVLSEIQVEAQDYSATLRQLKDVFECTRRIEVHNKAGDKVGETSVDYWRHTIRMRRS